MSGKRFSVYCIIFADASCYIGQTCKPVRVRISEHLKRPKNMRLATRFRSGMDYTYRILAEGLDAEAADKWERYAIENSANCLNVVDNPNRKPEIYPDR